MLTFQGKLDWEQDGDIHVATNETVTIIFPKSTRLGDPVHMFWQWSHVRSAVEETKVNVHLNATIDVIYSQSPAQVHYVDASQTDYQCVASFKDGGAPGAEPKLNIVMRYKGGSHTAAFLLHRHVDIKPDSPDYLYPSLPAPRMYLGKMNWYKYAVNDIFLIVCPSRIDEKSKVLAYWQWTETASGSKMVSCAVEADYEDITNGEQGLKFTYHDEEKYYTWKCEINEDDNTLTVNMSSQSGGTAKPFSLPLLTSEPELSLEPNTLAIYNDTYDFVFCSTRSGITDVGGTNPSISAFIPTILRPNEGFTNLDWAMKVAVTPFATIRAVDPLYASDLPSRQTLYPHDRIIRRSSGGWLDGNTELSLMRLYFEKKSQGLILQIGRISGTGSGTLKLSELFAGRSPIKMEILSTLRFPKVIDTQGLRSVRSICAIAGLKSGKVPSSEPGIFNGSPRPFTLTKSGDSEKATFAFYDYDATPSDLAFDPSSTLFLPLDSGNNFYFRGRFVPLTGLAITPKGGSNVGRNLGKASDRDEAVAKAAKTPGAWAYSWKSKQDASVWAWYPTTEDQVKIEQTNYSDYLFFFVHHLNLVDSIYAVAA